MLQKKRITKVLSTITLSSALLLSATVVAGNEQANVVEASTSSVKLTHNAYAYNYKGKRIKGARTLKKGRSVKAYRTKTIHGKKYLYIGSHRYIKLANVHRNKKGKSVENQTATSVNNIKSNDLFTVKVTDNGLGETYKAPNQSPTGEYIGVGQSVKVYAQEKVNGKTWYKIGANKWIPATDTDKFDTGEISSKNTQKADTQKDNLSTSNKQKYSNIINSNFANETEQAFVTQLNELRQSKGLSPLSIDNTLQSYAVTRANEANTKFDHIRPDGSRTQYAEVLAGGTVNDTSTPEQEASQQLRSFIYHDAGSNWGHRDILLSSQYTKIGVGFAFDPVLSNGFLGYSLIANLK
ncbi:SLAP domain-containing protein [uncultured Lactobacillus sp.]|uniref:SLAP domain-containing protein n=2 Tax=Bacteria TaxID=2 RepID=UPI00262A381A|nr:SLAP domain-containing protein [uncultured Lactobacillus sp.]